MNEHQKEQAVEEKCKVCNHKSFHSPWCWEKTVPKFEKKRVVFDE
ncbi:hypothetical protein [Shewanella aestuarii]|nr:hypothetical protein [Shewanella aestuarii]